MAKVNTKDPGATTFPPDAQQLYDGFLSYATASDYQAARRVEAFLESIHKLAPRAGGVIRRLQVCRDGSDFKLPKIQRESFPDEDPIWKIIVSQLQKARYLLGTLFAGGSSVPVGRKGGRLVCRKQRASLGAPACNRRTGSSP